MAAPVMVETVTIPLKVNRDKPTEPNNNVNTGFPFDDSDFDDRDRSFRSHIDDIVKRHPELAGHLNFDSNFDRFPFRSNTWGPKRRGSASSSDDSKPSGSTDSRRFGRPFGSRFEERFGFPFSRTFDGEPEYYQQQQTAQPQSKPQQAAPQQAAPQQQQQTQEQPQEENKPSEPEQETSTEKPPQVPNNERGRKQNPNIPQSSTVDLGQKQDPVHDNRGQRSMSAPPENRAGQQRYVSSINIPMNAGDGNQQAQQPQPQQQQQWQQQQQQHQTKAHPQQQSRSNERVIPIHVEGRDEPVVPKHGNQTFNQPPPQSSERVYSQPQPQPERIFGQRPAGFGHWERSGSPYYTGDQFFGGDPHFFPDESQYFEGGPQAFMNRGEPHQQRPNPEEYFAGPFRQQQYQKQPQRPQQQHQQHQQSAPPQQQQHPQQQQQQQQQQQPQQQPPPQEQQPQAPPPQPQAQAPKGPIDQIKVIQKDVLQFMDQVEKFNGKPRDKQYLYLDEMLTRNLLKLDDVDTEGKDNIRQARKEAINCIQRCISILEAKAAANEQLRSELMDIDSKIVNPVAPSEAPPAAVTTEPIPLACLEVGGTPRAGVEVKSDEQSEDNKPEIAEGATAMEVTASVPSETTEASDQTPSAPIQNEAEMAEVKKPEVESKIEETSTETKDTEQPKQESAEASTNVNEQPPADAANASQATEATKEEVKDKKEKKRVKKKEKTTDKAEKN